MGWLKNLFVTPNKEIMLGKIPPWGTRGIWDWKSSTDSYFFNPRLPLQPLNTVVTPKCSLEERLKDVLYVLLSGLKSTKRSIYIRETLYARKTAKRKQICYLQLVCTSIVWILTKLYSRYGQGIGFFLYLNPAQVNKGAIFKSHIKCLSYQ